MSRVGKQPIVLPGKVRAHKEGADFLVEGPIGKLSLAVPSEILVEVAGDQIQVKREHEGRSARAKHGLVRALVANMVKGVSEGFKRELDITGVGYRAEVKGAELHLAVGFSHPVVYPLPQGIKATVEKQTHVTLTGADSTLLGQVSARLRKVKPPEPYKGKGIRYSNEVIRRKAGKAAGGGAGAKGAK